MSHVIKADKEDTYHELTLLAGKGVTRLNDFSWNLIDEDSLLPGLQGLQRALFGYAAELFILDRKTVEFFSNRAC